VLLPNNNTAQARKLACLDYYSHKAAQRIHDNGMRSRPSHLLCLVTNPTWTLQTYRCRVTLAANNVTSAQEATEIR
jgi:hypothetical protein